MDLPACHNILLSHHYLNAQFLHLHNICIVKHEAWKYCTCFIDKSIDLFLNHSIIMSQK